MAGRIKQMIDQIVTERSKGNPFLERTTRTKLLLKGINPMQYTESSPDDPAILQKLKAVAQELGSQVTTM